jgi:biotin-(acetyl-CoA carboxylase) ligase
MMPEITPHIHFVYIGLSIILLLVGIGIGIGTQRRTVSQIEKDLGSVFKRQKALRGENGAPKMFVSVDECIDKRNQCGFFKDQLDDHGRSIKVIENYVRWRMHEDGMSMTDIDNYLKAHK